MIDLVRSVLEKNWSTSGVSIDCLCAFTDRDIQDGSRMPSVVVVFNKLVYAISPCVYSFMVL